MTLVLLTLFWISVAALLYAQLGYPALMIPFSRRRKVLDVDDASLPYVSFIIPAHNEQAVLRAKLENSLKIDYPPDKIEFLVASDGSVDNTIAIARDFESRGVRVLDFKQRRGKASIVTDAVAASRGEIVCLCDANVMFRHDALQRLVRHMQDPQVGAVSGDVRLASDESDFGSGESFYYRIERALQLGESNLGSMMGVDGGMFVVRRELFRPLAADTILDDFVTSMNVIQHHRRIVYEPEAIATENGTPSWRHEFKRRVRVNSGAMQCLKRGQFPPVSRPIELWQFMSHKFLRWVGPVFLILVLILSIYFINAGWIYRAAVAAQLLLYGTAIAAVYSMPLRSSRLGGVAFYFTLSHIAMLVGMFKGILQRQKGTWERTDRAPAGRDSGTNSPEKQVMNETNDLALANHREQRS